MRTDFFVSSLLCALACSISLEAEHVLPMTNEGTLSSTSLQPDDNCCYLFNGENFTKPSEQICWDKSTGAAIEKKFPFYSTEIKISAVLRLPLLTDFYRFTIIKEKGKGPSLKIMEIEPIQPKCIKCSKFGANVGKRGMCSVCYKQS